MSIDNYKFQFVGFFKIMRRWFCYFFVTFENDVLKSPFLSYFLRYKFIQVPSSAVDHDNPNPVPIGDGFGFLVYLC